MIPKRIIPCLDVDKGRVVKGTNFVGIQDAGDPVELARYYYEAGADEICFLDITASHEGRKATYETISRTAKEIFIPLTVGGGVNSVQDVEALLKAGADKVGINSGAVRNPNLIQEAAEVFGSQCIVIAVDAKRDLNSSQARWDVYVKGGREKTDLDALEWIKRSADLGAGEVLLTSIDGDGTKQGYDTELYAKASALVNIPIIASGGAGNLQHIIDVLESGADAALLASLLHQKVLTIDDIKQAMQSAKISARL